METLKSLCLVAKENFERQMPVLSGRKEYQTLTRQCFYATYRDALLEGYWRGMEDAKEVLRMAHYQRCLNDFRYWQQHYITIKKKQQKK